MKTSFNRLNGEFISRLFVQNTLSGSEVGFSATVVIKTTKTKF